MLLYIVKTRNFYNFKYSGWRQDSMIIQGNIVALVALLAHHFEKIRYDSIDFALLIALIVWGITFYVHETIINEQKMYVHILLHILPPHIFSLPKSNNSSDCSIISFYCFLQLLSLQPAATNQPLSWESTFHCVHRFIKKRLKSCQPVSKSRKKQCDSGETCLTFEIF